MLLGIDPGEVSGWATVTEDGEMKSMGQYNMEELYPWMNLWQPGEFSHIIVENFKVRPGVNFSWNEMATIRVIGAISFRAWQLGSKLVYQEPMVYGIGVKWAGATMPKNHAISHQIAALGHAVYFSHKILGNPIPAVAKMKAEAQVTDPSE